MTLRFLKRSALAAAMAVAPCMLLGCGDTPATTVPEKTPPIPVDAKGKPVGPPTAAGATPKTK